MRKYIYQGKEYEITDKEYNAYAKDVKDLGLSEDEILEGICIEKSSDYSNYTVSEKKPRVNKPREKKEDVDKNFITNVIANALAQNCENVVIENMGKMISFDFNGKPYTVDIKFARNKYKARVDK